MTADAPALDSLGPNELYQHFWNTKYGPEMAATRRVEAERRTDAFVEGAAFMVCGETLRLMTPRDLLLLDSVDNAFVCMTEPTEADLAWFLWVLSQSNDGSRSWANRWRKGRLTARIGARTSLEDDASEVYHYLDRLWIDTSAESEIEKGEKKERKPSGVYCLAPLLVNVAAVVGAVDPMSGRLLADTPIPRLLQYQRSAMERKNGEADATSFDSYRSRCLEEVNDTMAKRRKQ